MNWQQDPNGNWLARFVFPERTTEFTVTVDLLADMSVINPFDFFVDPVATNYPFVYPSEFDEELAPYLARKRPGRCCANFSRRSRATPQNIVDFIVALNQRLQGDIRYLVRMDPGVQTPEETLKLASGSCRDTAWLLVQILRHLGLAARFVSGYLIQLRSRSEVARRSGRRHRRTSPICTPGPRSICRAPAGSGSIRPRACCAARGTCRSPRRRTSAPPRRSPAASSRPRSNSPSR